MASAGFQAVHFHHHTDRNGKHSSIYHAVPRLRGERDQVKFDVKSRPLLQKFFAAALTNHSGLSDIIGLKPIKDTSKEDSVVMYLSLKPASS